MTYICILRGINVSGKNLIKMAALKEAFEKAGFKNIRIYIQSGNVVFEDKSKNEEDLKKKIEKLIADTYELKVPVLVRNLEYWNWVIENNPFISQQDIDPSRLHVTFLSEEPENEKLEKIKDLTLDNDRFIVIGKTVYLHTPNGYGNSKINNSFFENKLKVTATTRNWKTVNELKRISDSI